MKIVVAVDSFKGSCSASDVADSIERGIGKVFPNAQIDKLPLSDGGEGLIETLLTAMGGKLIEILVTGPTGKRVNAAYAILSDGTAVIEMARASGLTLIAENERDVYNATTYGTGELIKAALDVGCKNILIGIGGSATNDGGAGMAQALGAHFLDENGVELRPGGKELSRLREIDIRGLHTALKGAKLTVACDVSNPLCGRNGASAIYGPQKGATKEMIEVLDRALLNYSSIVSGQLNKNVAGIPGSGAAGGLGAGLMAFCEAELMSGMDIVCDILKVEEHILGADILITGEGRIDGQSINGKVPCAIAKRAKKHGVPVIGIAGSLGQGFELAYDEGIDVMLSIVNKPMTLDAAMQGTQALVEETAERAMRLFKIGLLKGDKSYE